MSDFKDDEYFSNEEVQELMADIADEFLNDKEENNYEMINLVNEDGEEEHFKVLGIVEYQQKNYIVLMPIDKNTTVILELVPDDENQFCTFAPVSDDMLYEIFDRFKEEHANEFNFQ